jgi:GAF domain-containing protein
MKRRSKVSGKPAKARRAQASKPKRSPQTTQASRPTSPSPADAGEIARLNRELSEALERQTATSQVLQIISSFAGELYPVFRAILANATRICEAKFGVLMLREGEGFRSVAIEGAPATYTEAMRQNPYIPPRRGSGLVVLAQTKQPVQMADLQAEPGYVGNRLTTLGGARTLLIVPVLRKDELVGAINIYRQEVRPFTDKQVELLTNFAAQAVIAIENARLLNELRQRTTNLTEALEQQTATSKVLQVISGSPGDLQPVFASILENATRICGASFGNLDLNEDGAFRIAAMHNAPAAFAEARRRSPLMRPHHPSAALTQVVATKRHVQIVNLTEHVTYQERSPPYVDLVEKAGARTLLVVPLLKDDELVGLFAIYRQDVRAFGDKQIELVKNFAAQAVIAIENARLLNELRQRTDELSQRSTDLTEALEQQTATSEVLQVISRSAGDLEPVFASMLKNAVRICDAKFGIMNFPEPSGFRLVAMHNAPEAFVSLYGAARWSISDRNIRLPAPPLPSKWCTFLTLSCMRMKMQ